MGLVATTRAGGALVALLAASMVVAACSSKERDRPVVPQSKPEPVVDTAADQVAAERGWALAVARDSKPIAELARFEGWQKYFIGDAGAAVASFMDRGMPGELAARIGLARAALDLARAHADLQQLQIDLTPPMVAALATRPDAKDAAPWVGYVAARQLQASGAEASAVAARLAGIDPASPAAKWGALLADDAADPAAKLLRGEAEGLDATLPPGATAAYAERLNVAALVRAGRGTEALKRWRRIPGKAPDFEVASGQAKLSLRDPLALRGAVWAYATLAKDALKGLEGWPTLLRAHAELLLGEAKAAAATAGALADAPPEGPAPFAQLALTGNHDGAEVALEARALQARALRLAGDDAGAEAALERLPSDTINARVLRLWAGAPPAKVAEFPRDRDVLGKVLLEKFEAMGDSAKGAADFSQLALADRYVDAVQRRYADGLFAADRKALAVKTYEAAEDKSQGLAPSRRNLVTSMVATARMNVGINRPRVALKYLSRLDERLPAVAGPAEILRDLLSLQAMENAGGVTAGQ